MQQIDLYSVSVLCVYEAEGALARGAASCGRRGGRAAERGPSPEREQRVEIVSEPRTWCPPAPRVPTSGRDARPESYINKTYRMEYEKRAVRTVYIRTLSTPLLRQNRTVLPRRRTMYGKAVLA